MKGMLSTDHAAALYGKDRRTFRRHALAQGIEAHVMRGHGGRPQHFYRRVDVLKMKKRVLS